MSQKFFQKKCAFAWKLPKQEDTKIWVSGPG